VTTDALEAHCDDCDETVHLAGGHWVGDDDLPDCPGHADGHHVGGTTY
jgi:hypothetical protein